MDQDVFIWGNKERGEEVIKELEKRGGTTGDCICNGRWLSGIYFIYKGEIHWADGESTLGNIIQKYFTEIKLPELPKEKVHFEPFDKVLMCQGKGSYWVAAFFSFYNKDKTSIYKYRALSLYRFKYCIPYEGNEHLNGKEFKTEDIEKYDFE